MLSHVTSNCVLTLCTCILTGSVGPSLIDSMRAVGSWRAVVTTQFTKKGIPNVGPGAQDDGLRFRGRFAAIAGKVVDAVNRSDHHALMELYSTGMREATPEHSTIEILRRVKERHGALVKFSEVAWNETQSTFHVIAEKGEWELLLILTDAGLINTLTFDDSKYLIIVPKRNATSVRLPFSGRWKVTAGGTTPLENHHRSSRADSANAIDFALVDAQGRTEAGLTTKNSDVYSYGKEILSVANGVVETVIDGIPDNAVGSIDTAYSGNTIIVRHSDFEFGVYMHVQAFSARVKWGERVTAGQVIALCGNSGNSPGAHLHFHMCNSHVGQIARGFPVYFERVRVTRNGQTTIKNQYSPVQGDIIEQDGSTQIMP
jgi:Peptidase family M23